MVTEPLQSEMMEAEKRAALDFALHSESLTRSDRLKRLLSYLCEAELAGNGDQLTEYDIAVSALGRRADFSPSEDSAVRSRTYELRQKLEKLYLVEAPAYPVRIELPKGSYKPKFHRNETAASEQKTQAMEAAVAPHAEGKRRWTTQWLIFGAFVLGVAGTLLSGRLYRGQHEVSFAQNDTASTAYGWTPELRELWAPILSAGRPVDVIFETRLFIGFTNSYLVVRDPSVENIQDLASSQQLLNIKRVLKGDEPFEARRYADFSVSNAMFSLGRLLATAGVPLKAERSADMSIDDIRTANFVLLGKSSGFDRLNGLPPNDFNFVFEGKHRIIRNLNPRPGELSSYTGGIGAAQTGALIDEYALITMTPGTGKGQRILNLESDESELYGALALYMTDPQYAKQLTDHLRLPSGKLPEFYEVLVKIEERGLKPVSISYVTHRVLDISKAITLGR